MSLPAAPPRRRLLSENRGEVIQRAAARPHPQRKPRHLSFWSGSSARMRTREFICTKSALINVLLSVILGHDPRARSDAMLRNFLASKLAPPRHIYTPHSQECECMRSLHARPTHPTHPSHLTPPLLPAAHPPDFRSSGSKVSDSSSPPHAAADCPRFPPRGKSAATNTAPARKQIGCPMAAVVFGNSLFKKVARITGGTFMDIKRLLDEQQGRTITVVLVGNGLRSGRDRLNRNSSRFQPASSSSSSSPDFLLIGRELDKPSAASCAESFSGNQLRF